MDDWVSMIGAQTGDEVAGIDSVDVRCLIYIMLPWKSLSSSHAKLCGSTPGPNNQEVKSCGFHGGGIFPFQYLTNLRAFESGSADVNFLVLGSIPCLGICCICFVCFFCSFFYLPSANAKHLHGGESGAERNWSS